MPRRHLFTNVLRKIFLEDWLLKLVALTVTLGLWLGVTGLSTPATKRLTVQLVPNVPNNTEITDDPISEVDIVISGDERKLKTLSGNGLVAALDLTSMQPGDRAISLTPENVSVDLPLGVKLDEIQPSRIAVRLESVEELELPVKADIDGKPAKGFEIYSETVMPQRVRVRGPASFMRTLDVILTDKISVDGKSESFTAGQVPLGVSNPKTTVFNTVVDVVVRIGEERVEKLFVFPVPNQPGKTATAILYGPKTILAKIKKAEVKVEIVKDENGAETPQFNLPPEIEVRNAKLRK